MHPLSFTGAPGPIPNIRPGPAFIISHMLVRPETSIAGYAQ